MLEQLQLPTESIRQQLLDNNLGYLIAPAKLPDYAERPIRTIPLNQPQRKFFNGFSDPTTGQIHLDLVDCEPTTIPAVTVGINNQFLENARSAQKQWLESAHAFLSTPDGARTVRSILTSIDAEKLEYPEFTSANRPLRDSMSEFGYLSPATMIRIDELLSENGGLLACDPNLIPLGYAFMHGFYQTANKEITPNFDLDIYANRIGKLIEDNGSNPSGILTGLNYPNWLSHLYVARKVREISNLPFYVIPLEAMTPSGTVNTATLKEFYETLEFDNITVADTGEIPASLIIRYSREANTIHPATRVINYPGFRVLESQFWNALFTLPGFTDNLAETTGIQFDTNLHRQTNIPTLLARRNSEQIKIASELTPDHKFQWINLSDATQLLTSLQTNIFTSDKPSEWTWFLKTLSTSGKKGVRITNGGKVEKAEKNISKILNSLNHQGTFLIQPKVRSTVTTDEEQRLKLDLFLSGDDFTIAGYDAMLTPLHQRSSHGGSSTRLALIL